jgi:hypothetical protein
MTRKLSACRIAVTALVLAGGVACNGTGGSSGPSTYAKPNGSDCPDGYPIKAFLDGTVNNGHEYFTPGNSAYSQRTPLLCYVDEAAARQGGYEASPFNG